MSTIDKVNTAGSYTDNEKMRMHFITLAFRGELEKLFAKRMFENKNYIIQIRTVLLLTIAFYSGFGLLDVVLVPDGFLPLFWIRFGVVCPFISFVILLTYTKFYEKIIQLSFALVAIIAGGGIVLMIVLTPPPATYSYYAGLILVFMFVYTFGRVRFIWATFSGWVLIIFYEITAIYFIDTPLPVLINNNFFFISANIIGMVSCYLFEYFDRKNYLTSRQLEIEKRKTKEINQKLEKRVFERTALLNNSNEDLKLEIKERKRIEEELRKVSNELEIRVENRTFELVNANKELEKAKKTADASALVKSEFLANMSHEIRNPMNAIIGMADLAMNDKLHKDQRNKYLDIIRTSSRSLLVIINDILDISKIEAGKLEFDIRSFNIRDYVESVGDIFINELNSKGVEFIIDIADDLPAMAKGDPIRLQQVLLNLIGNALKFTDTGEICLKLSKGNEFKKKIELLFEVSDTGIGIDLNEKQNLFEAFAQGDGSITRKYGGTGLGLTICKRIVNLMNGNIHVESKPGNGSIFKFSVVLERDFNSISEDKTGKSEKVEALDVLLIINNQKLQDVCARILNSYGFYVSSVNNSAHAIELIKSMEKTRKFDLLIVDEDMQEGNCSEEIEKLKNASGDLFPKVILLGNVKTKSEISKLQSIGISSYISKPLKSSTLFDSIIVLFNNIKSKYKKPTEDFFIADKFTDMKILLVEDNPINQIVASEILMLGGVSIKKAENGVEAIKTLKKESFDLVLMDVQMPKLDGIETTKLIRSKLKNDVPVIAMTAHVMQGDRDKCIEAGMNNFISKPIDRELLFKILDKYYANKQNRRKSFFQTENDIPELKLDGIDITDAIKRLNCDQRVFSEILLNFCGFYNNIAGKLKDWLASGDIQKIKNEVHSIKGAAINVSAVNLYLAAKDFENALEASRENLYCKMIAELEKQFNEVVQSSQFLKEHVELKVKQI